MTALSNETGGQAGGGRFRPIAPEPTGGVCLCQTCARNGRSCCQGHDIYVTWGDCRRILSHTRQSDFFEYRACGDAAYADQDDDPVWRQHVFRPDGTRRVLRQRENGDCIFLADTGCQLPLAVRPLICRLFPHVYSAIGLAHRWDMECLAARIDPAAVVAAGIAGVGDAEAVCWHRMLYDEIMWEGLVDEDWADL